MSWGRLEVGEEIKGNSDILPDRPFAGNGEIRMSRCAIKKMPRSHL